MSILDIAIHARLERLTEQANSPAGDKMALALHRVNDQHRPVWVSAHRVYACCRCSSRDGALAVDSKHPVRSPCATVKAIAREIGIR